MINREAASEWMQLPFFRSKRWKYENYIPLPDNKDYLHLWKITEAIPGQQIVYK
jgi:hypothetical protein